MVEPKPDRCNLYCIQIREGTDSPLLSVLLYILRTQSRQNQTTKQVVSGLIRMLACYENSGGASEPPFSLLVSVVCLGQLLPPSLFYPPMKKLFFGYLDKTLTGCAEANVFPKKDVTS